MLKSFGAWLALLGTLGGFYVGARAIHLVWLFVVVVALAAVLSLFVPTFKKIGEIYTKYRGYPTLLGNVSSLQREVNDLRNAQAAGQDDVAAAFANGVDEGKRQLLGSHLSQNLRQMPRLVSLSEGDDQVLLVTDMPEGCEVKRGTRFSVVVSATNTLRGVVEVLTVNEPERQALLYCVDRTSEKFWSGLEERAGRDASPPADVELQPYVATMPDLFEEDDIELDSRQLEGDGSSND